MKNLFGTKKVTYYGQPDEPRPDLTPQSYAEPKRVSLWPDNNAVLATLFAETKNEPDAGVQAAFDTIRNRSSLHSRPWVSTVAAPGQYSGYGNPDYTNAMNYMAGTGKLSDDAQVELNRMRTIMDDYERPVSDNTNLYLNPVRTMDMYGKLPGWTNKLNKIKTVGKHDFYYDPYAI